jgi:hypothetical protein
LKAIEKKALSAQYQYNRQIVFSIGSKSIIRVTAQQAAQENSEGSRSQYTIKKVHFFG